MQDKFRAESTLGETYGRGGDVLGPRGPDDALGGLLSAARERYRLAQKGSLYYGETALSTRTYASGPEHALDALSWSSQACTVTAARKGLCASPLRSVPRGTTPSRHERLAAGAAVKRLCEDRHLCAALGRKTQLPCFSFPLTGPPPSRHLRHQARGGGGGFPHQAFLQQRRRFLQRTWMPTLRGEGISPRRPPPTPWLTCLPFPSPPAKCVLLGPPCRLLPRTGPGPSAPRWHASALTMTSNRKSFSFSSAFQGEIIYSCVSSTQNSSSAL